MMSLLVWCEHVISSGSLVNFYGGVRFGSVWWVFDLCGWVELCELFGWLKYGNKRGRNIEIDEERD